MSAEITCWIMAVRIAGNLELILSIKTLVVIFLVDMEIGKYLWDDLSRANWDIILMGHQTAKN